MSKTDALDDAKPRDKCERDCIESVDLLTKSTSEVNRREETEDRSAELREEVNDRGLAKAHTEQTDSYELKSLPIGLYFALCSAGRRDLDD